MKKFLLISMVFYTALFADVYATYEIKAQKEASLNVVSQGIVATINANVGTKVEKGTVLLVLNDKEEKAALEMAKSEYQFLVAQYKRYENSSEVFDKNTLDKLRAELDKAKSSMLLSEEKVAKMKLVAPFAGIIAEKNIELGDMTGSSTKPLFKLVSHEKKLLLAFDSQFANQINVGNDFCFKKDATESQSVCTKISKVYPVINTETKKLYAEADGVDLKIGTFGDGTIKTK
ncbi:efflux RND transporter periplasmic adaptor subunit [Sulfurospirillum sp.]|uniref:efflux RND transporter periplasmic adaptor subunit n=1 Tax=Sulfurospirillum sp. TaxID=2053622 RepID=UPI002FDEB677